MKRKWFESYGRATLFKAALKVELGVVATIIDGAPGGFIVEWNGEES